MTEIQLTFNSCTWKQRSVCFMYGDFELIVREKEFKRFGITSENQFIRSKNALHLLTGTSIDEIWYVSRVAKIDKNPATHQEQRLSELTTEVTRPCLSEVLVCDRIFQDKDNDSTWRHKVLDPIFCCHQLYVTPFMPPPIDTLQHSISFVLSQLICAFKTKAHSQKLGSDCHFNKRRESH